MKPPQVCVKKEELFFPLKELSGTIGEEEDKTVETFIGERMQPGEEI